MKTFKLLSKFKFIALITALALTSCSKDESPVPKKDPIQPTLSASGQTDFFKGIVESQDQKTLKVGVKANAPDGFKSLTIYKIVNNVSSIYESIDNTHPNYIKGSNIFSYNLEYTVTEEDIDKPFKFRAKVTDTDGKSAEADFASGSAKSPLNFLEKVTLETVLPVDPWNLKVNYYLILDNNGNLKGINQATMVSEGLSDKVIAIFSANETHGFNLVAPKNLSEADAEVDFLDKITNPSSTRFITVTNDDIDFSKLTKNSTYELEETFQKVANRDQKIANQIDKDKTYIFRTDNNKTGILKIKIFESVKSDKTLTGVDYLTTMNLFITK